jgi:hypothetical protein
MSFRRADWIYVIGAGLVVLLVSLLPSPRGNNPRIPNTPEHRLIRSEQDCVRCHAPGQIRPLAARHPKRQDCSRCHAHSAEAAR